jgi:propionate CoA-transferase
VCTYIDPELRGGKFTDACSADLVEKINFRGKPHLFYPTWPLDVGIVRATAADEFGNLSFEDEALFSSNLGIALAVKASGGTVIAQVQRVVPRGERAATDVSIPGSLVDRIVVAPDQIMVTETPLDPHYLGRERLPLDDLPRLPGGPDTIIARRASAEVRKRELSIFGFGAAANIPLAMAGEGLFANGGLNDYEFTTEHGSFGGVVMSG